jgi:hypothetical protein
MIKNDRLKKLKSIVYNFLVNIAKYNNCYLLIFSLSSLLIDTCSFPFAKIKIFCILIVRGKYADKSTRKKNSHKTKGLQTSGLKPVKRTVKKTDKKVTWDEIQAGFKELEKAQKEAWAAIRETQQAHKETEKAIRETQKNIGGLSNTLGSIVERILTPGLPEKFKKLGYSFNRITSYSYAAGVYILILNKFILIKYAGQKLCVLCEKY